jgi:tetratricopeptide (TPR) repeat protein
MRRRLKLALAFSALATLACAAAIVHAQREVEISPALGVALDEERAMGELEERHYIKAREIAEGILREQVRARVPDRDRSIVAHHVLGQVHHFGEANFARALFYQERAYRLYMRGRSEEDETTRGELHARIVLGLVETHGALEHYQEQLDWMLRFSDRYPMPPLIAERAWPLMKLRRFEDAREAARLGQATGDPRQTEVALNALCATEFEAGNDQASYDACLAAMNLHGADPNRQSVVDFTNFAEAARGVFRLDEAERVGLLATEARVSWYGSPWMELGELYLREGRFAESLQALERVPEYRQQRPPHVRDADRNESRRALTSFFLVIGQADNAVEVAEKALNAPDRRSSNSRDPAQDRAITALVHRAALRLRAEQRVEDAIGAPFYERIAARASAQNDRFRAWLSGRVAARNLADDERLIGTFMIGTHRSAVMPPWLVGELADVLGAGVMREAVRRARAEDSREGSDAYYDAFEADAALAGGDDLRARELATRALASLQPAEAMLRARMTAIVAEASRREGDTRRAAEAYGEAFQADPGIFRRFGWTIPVRMQVSGDATAEQAADLIAGSDRIANEDWGLTIRVEADRAAGQACLLDASGSTLSCANERANADGEAQDEFAARLARSFLTTAFAPRIDLSQTDANSLDGSNRVSRDPLRTLFGHEPPPRD